jgi:hypothetical protein
LVFGLRHVASFTGLSIFDCSFDILFTFIILTMIYLKTLFTVKQQLARYMTSGVNVMTFEIEQCSIVAVLLLPF